ncbi:MAG TPA: glycoside hydrolase family 30 beta sandwich domain-containing protein [Candidatus Dormibacteraeota bacterium]|nr:glycoside hydrolase family 30 beta sandwich domain-containing protein [Candidatus Dormibacteraeota bacterium]
MSSEQTRRTFLKASALGLAATTTIEWADAFEPAPAPQSQEITVRVTGGTLRYSSAPSLTWRAADKIVENAIELNPAQKLQEMLGFGAAFTDAACYTFNRLAAPARAELFHDFFHPSQMGLNVCRTCMGSSDYSTEMFSYDEGDPDPEMKRFSIAHDQAYVLPMMREARKINPDLFLFSSPWSPPGWMKAGGSMLGGSMRQRYFAPYAQYFVKFLQAYATEGVPVQAVTVQNEVDTDQDARMPACSWPQEYEMAFVKNHLGPALQKAGLSTRIWILDHNYNLWGRAVAELDDPGVHKFCNAVAFHGYVGTPDQMSKFHQAYPDAQVYWTEGGPDYTQPDYATDWANWAQTFTQAIRNWCQSITGWNLALDEKGRPNIGPFSCGGMVTIHSQTNEITRSGQYWAFAHFSRNVRRGAKRFQSECKVQNVDQVAFENPDGQKVLVVTNSGPARTVRLKQANKIAELALAPNSVSTLTWS